MRGGGGRASASLGRHALPQTSPTVPVLPPLTSSDDSACSALDERLQTWQTVQITGTSRPRPIPSVHGPAVNGRCTPDTSSERSRGSKQTLGVPRKLSSLPAVFFPLPLTLLTSLLTVSAKRQTSGLYPVHVVRAGYLSARRRYKRLKGAPESELQVLPGFPHLWNTLAEGLIC